MNKKKFNKEMADYMREMAGLTPSYLKEGQNEMDGQGLGMGIVKAMNGGECPYNEEQQAPEQHVSFEMSDDGQLFINVMKDGQNIMLALTPDEVSDLRGVVDTNGGFQDMKGQIDDAYDEDEIDPSELAVYEIQDI